MLVVAFAQAASISADNGSFCGPALTPTVLLGDTVHLVLPGIQQDTVDSLPPFGANGVSTVPIFPGGDAAKWRFLANNVTYPSSCRQIGEQGKVYVKYIINEQGKVSQVEIVRGVHPLIDEEVLRVIRAMPDWTPATQNGVPVAVSLMDFVKFSLQ